jgi:predicted GIY-YIG superfamily endonuclease
MRRPVKLIYWEECSDRRSAQRRELALKRLPHAKKLALAASFESP